MRLHSKPTDAADASIIEGSGRRGRKCSTGETNGAFASRVCRRRPAKRRAVVLPVEEWEKPCRSSKPSRRSARTTASDALDRNPQVGAEAACQDRLGISHHAEREGAEGRASLRRRVRSGRRAGRNPRSTRPRRAGCCRLGAGELRPPGARPVNLWSPAGWCHSARFRASSRHLKSSAPWSSRTPKNCR